MTSSYNKRKADAAALKRATTAAQRTKTHIHTCLGSSASLLADVKAGIAQNGPWKWAASALCDLEAAREALEAAIAKSPFAQDMLKNALEDIKATHGTTVQASFSSFVANIDPLVKNLEEESTVLLDLHRRKCRKITGQ